MRRIHIFILLILAVSSLATWTLVFVLRRSQSDPVAALFVLPSETLKHTPTRTPPATLTPTSTLTPTATTPTATATLTPTLTPTLATRVVEISAVIPGVVVPPTATPFPAGTILLTAPPQPVEPLPDATNEPPPYGGWYSFESDHPLVGYSTPWPPRQTPGRPSCQPGTVPSQ